MFRYTSNLSRPEVRDIAKDFQPSIEKLTPHLYAEIEGIAVGAELDVLDIVALNSRSEIALGKFSDGCTSLCWKKNENTRVLAQNWDWTARVAKNLVRLTIEQAGKPTVYMITEVSPIHLHTVILLIYAIAHGCLFSRLALLARLASTLPELEPVSMPFAPNL